MQTTIANVPTKNDPDNLAFNTELTELNAFLADLQQLVQDTTKDNGLRQSARDAIKVVDCLRFIKVNLAEEGFIRFAFLHRHNPNYGSAIYVHDTDHDNGVLRDLNNTAFHLNAYTDISVCVQALNRIINEFESATAIARQHNKLEEFVGKIRYDGEVGCLEVRISPCLIYVVSLQQNSPKNIDDLIGSLARQFTGDYNHDINLVLTHCQAYLNQDVMIDNVIYPLTREKIIERMQTIFGYEAPTTLSLSLATDTERAQHALELITQQRALVKMISCPIDNNINLQFMLSQLADPSKVRPVKKLRDGANRYRIWNTKSKTWGTREITAPRGRAKPNKVHTKKEATSLLPSHGKMQLFPVMEPAVGVLFDSNNCDLKNEKYVWPSNVVSNNKWWIAGAVAHPVLVPSERLAEIRRNLAAFAAQNRVPRHNELLVGLSKEAFKAIFITHDSLQTRLNAIRVKYLCQEQLGIELPILILSTQESPQHYSSTQQYQDCLSGRRYLSWFAEHELAQIILTAHPELETQSMFQGIESLQQGLNQKNAAAIQAFLSAYTGTFDTAQAQYIMYRLTQFEQGDTIIPVLLTKLDSSTKEHAKFLLQLKRELTQGDYAGVVQSLKKHKLTTVQAQTVLAFFIECNMDDSNKKKLMAALIKSAPTSTETLLRDAICQGDEFRALCVLSHNAAVDSALTTEQCLLWLAIQAGLTRVVTELLKKVNVTTLQYALFCCANDEKHDRTADVVLLLQAKKQIDVDAYTDSDRNTALHRAAAHNRTEMIKALCARGGNVNRINHAGQSALVIALVQQQFADAELMIASQAHGFDGIQLNGALQLIAQHNQESLALALLQKTAQENKNSLLLDSVHTDFPSADTAIRWLCQSGADPSALVGSEQQSVMYYVVVQEKYAALALMIEYGKTLSGNNAIDILLLLLTKQQNELAAKLCDKNNKLRPIMQNLEKIIHAFEQGDFVAVKRYVGNYRGSFSVIQADYLLKQAMGAQQHELLTLIVKKTSPKDRQQLFETAIESQDIALAFILVEQAINFEENGHVLYERIVTDNMPVILSSITDTNIREKLIAFFNVTREKIADQMFSNKMKVMLLLSAVTLAYVAMPNNPVERSKDYVAQLLNYLHRKMTRDSYVIGMEVGVGLLVSGLLFALLVHDSHESETAIAPHNSSQPIHKIIDGYNPNIFYNGSYHQTERLNMDNTVLLVGVTSVLLFFCAFMCIVKFILKSCEPCSDYRIAKQQHDAIVALIKLLNSELLPAATPSCTDSLARRVHGFFATPNAHVRLQEKSDVELGRMQQLGNN